MRQIGLIVLMVIFAGCGPSQEEIDNVATVTCNIIGASRNMDGAMRIREINNAREKIGAEPYLGGDELIRQSLEYGLCESMVMNLELLNLNFLLTHLLTLFLYQVCLQLLVKSITTL